MASECIIVGMTDASDYLENELLDHFLGTGAFTAPTNVYLQLHTGAAGEDGTANTATENTRKVMSFAAATGGTATTDADLDWTSVAATETVSHYSIWDAVSGGNCLAVGTLTASKSLTIGDNLQIAAGDLTVSLA